MTRDKKSKVSPKNKDLSEDNQEWGTDKFQRVTYNREKFMKGDIISNYLTGKEPQTQEEWKAEILRWRLKVLKLEGDLKFVELKLKDPEFLDEMLKSRKSLTEMLAEDEDYVERAENDPAFRDAVIAFSFALEYSLSSGTIRNPELGTYSKTRADEFAEEMGEHLDKVRAEGFTSTRKIAERFNELGLKSGFGKDWSFNAVARLIRRRKELGLEGGTDGESLDAG